MTLILKEAMQVTKICHTMDDIFDACSSYLRLLENTYICKHNTSNNEHVFSSNIQRFLYIANYLSDLVNLVVMMNILV